MNLIRQGLVACSQGNLISNDTSTWNKCVDITIVAYFYHYINQMVHETLNKVVCVQLEI